MWPFTNKSAPPLDTKGTAVPEDWLLELFGASVAGSNAVSAATALQVPAVQAAVRVISEAAACLDVTVKRRVGDQEVDVPDHPAARLLTGQANPWLSGYELVRDLVSEALTHDAGGFAWVNRVQRRPAEVIHYDSGSIGVQYSGKGTGEPTYRLTGRKINAADVVHLRGPFSKCPLTLAREAIGVAHVMERHAGQFFRNGARPSGVLESPKPVGDAGVVKMAKAFAAAFGGAENSGKTPLLWDGTTYRSMTMSSVDSQFLQLRVYQNLEICRAFGLPPSMAYELERATWSNAEQASREFITWTLQPWVKALESALSRALLTDEERGEYRIAFDLDDTSQADLTARATAISTLITARVINPDTARNWLGLGPRPGGQEYANPAIDVTKPAAPAANDNPKPGVPDAANQG